MTDVSEVLRSAVKVIELDGWTQGTYGHKGQAHCTVGAIREAIIERGNPTLRRARTSWSREQEDLYQRTMKAPGGCIFPTRYMNAFTAESSIIHWNDGPGCTAYAVVDTLNNCAGREEAQG